MVKKIFRRNNKNESRHIRHPIVTPIAISLFKGVFLKCLDTYQNEWVRREISPPLVTKGFSFYTDYGIHIMIPSILMFHMYNPF